MSAISLIINYNLPIINHKLVQYNNPAVSVMFLFLFWWWQCYHGTFHEVDLTEDWHFSNTDEGFYEGI